MLADSYTKLLQRSLFRKFRDVIIGLEHIPILKMDAIASDQEHVVNTVETVLNKSLPTEIAKSDNIATEECDIGKSGIRKDDANMNKSIHRKQTYAQIVVGGKMRGSKLNSSNIVSGEK